MLLQPKLNLKVSQRQVLTPGLVQMVSVLALNKLELKDMINAEVVENPVLDEVEESGPTMEELSGLEGDRERSAEDLAADKLDTARDEKDPFDEIDFGSYFQDYLDPGFRSPMNFEEFDKPSFEHFLSQPSTLTDHLTWQLGALKLKPKVREAAELVIGNLDENGYLSHSVEELVETFQEQRSSRAPRDPIPFERGLRSVAGVAGDTAASSALVRSIAASGTAVLDGTGDDSAALRREASSVDEDLRAIQAGLETVQQMDPAGVAARDLRECLLLQVRTHRKEAGVVLRHRGVQPVGDQQDVFVLAERIISDLLPLLQKRDMRELTRSCGHSAEEVQTAVAYIRTLDPRPGQRYNQNETRLIEPDVAFVKRDGGFVVVMNEEDLPSLRLNQSYRRMLSQKGTEREVKDYVRERYKSAIQLLRNIEQRKNTILRTCESIVRRQAEFLEHGEQALKPMMIKEVAEEIGVHPSTVSRAVANKYVHTPGGVYELRYFFSEGVNGPEGGDLPLILLKKKVRKLIEEEDTRRPLTDDQLAAELQAQGISVTRRTVAKYREDMQIPSTHQRRVR